MNTTKKPLSSFDDKDLKHILDNDEHNEYLFEKAAALRCKIFGNNVYIRGLIEISNYCKNNCFYCGIRCENSSLLRYRLEMCDILNCCDNGYKLGFRTFVLQGGEDAGLSDKFICNTLYSIKSKYPNCAITLSLGEKSKKTYLDYFSAGADRYLLKHETADKTHYEKLHPKSMSIENRKKCLFYLKEIGFEVGSGFMVGSPYQNTDNIVSDLKFLEELQPDMIGIGPFIRHPQTPFGKFENGSLSLTLKLISVLRLMFPYANIPATTALETIAPKGRELGLKAGANVVMPNLTPKTQKRLYDLYENKSEMGIDISNGLDVLKQSLSSMGYKIAISRGDAKKPQVFI